MSRGPVASEQRFAACGALVEAPELLLVTVSCRWIAREHAVVMQALVWQGHMSII